MQETNKMVTPGPGREPVAQPGGPSCGVWPDGTAWPPGPLPPPHLPMQPWLLEVQALGGRRSLY